MPFSPRNAYRIGTYVLFPALAAGGGFLLARAGSAAGLAVAGLLLLSALVLPAALGAYCRRCGDGLGAGLLRLLVLPTILVALFFRSGKSVEQGVGLSLLGLGVLSFVVAWRLTDRASQAE